MKFRSMALAATALLVFAFTSFAQITAVEGIVKGTDGKPVPNAKINIVRTDIKGSYPTKTDKKGHYIYMGLPMGKYDISVEVDGKVVDKTGGVQTRPGDPTPVNFDLKANQAETATKQAEVQKAMETGQISKELERQMSPEEKAKMQKQIEETASKMKARKELNDAFNQGMTAEAAKQWPEAIAAFVKAGEFDPAQQAVWSHLGEAYIMNANGKTGAEYDTNIQKALEAYDKSIALKPDDPASHNNYALALAKAKKFPEMQNELKKAADLDPANAGKYYYNLGALLVNNSQNEAAGDAFKKAVELQPNYADAYYQLGVTLVAKAQISSDGKVTPVAGTVEAFQKYLELAPTGQFAQPSKEMLTTLGSSVELNYKNPDAQKKKKK